MDGFGLPGVGRDDLQVRPGAEREQRVVSAESDVLAAGLRTDPEALFEVGDGHGEVGDGVDEVVNEHGNLASATCRGRNCRSGPYPSAGGIGSTGPIPSMAFCWASLSNASAACLD